MSKAAVAQMKSRRINLGAENTGFFSEWDPSGSPFAIWCEDSKTLAKAIDLAFAEGADFRIDARWRECVVEIWQFGPKGSKGDSLTHNMTGHVWVSNGAKQRVAVCQMFELMTKGALEVCVVGLSNLSEFK